MSNEPVVGTTGLLFREIPGVSPPVRKYPYRSVTAFGYAVATFCGLNVLALVVQALALIGQWLVLGQIAQANGTAGDALIAAARASDARVGMAALLLLFTLIPAYVLGAVWTYNASCNARALGGRGQISPGWAVGWYVVPFLSLVKPFQAMEEIWEASFPPSMRRSRGSAVILRWWWAAWLIAGIGGNAIALISRGFTAPSDLAGLTLFQVADSCVEMASASLFAVVVWRVTKAQTAAHAGSSELVEVFA